MPTIKLFFAQPVDFIEDNKIKKNVGRLQNLIKDMRVEIVAPYLDEEYCHDSTIQDRELTKQIVRKDYNAIDKCDVFLVDFSKKDHQPVGIVFEMAYAYKKKKKIVVYTGGSIIGQRVWIVATADYICKTWKEVKRCVGEIIEPYNTETK